MADVFISYSRQDKPFVEKLHAALENEGRDVWIDWEGIPPTAEWLTEIYAAIEAGDTFVFVISPDSIESEICGKELAHALKHKKRLVPIVSRQVDESLVPDKLRVLNWLFFRETDDFATAFESLKQALDTDLDWVRTHTRLLVRAIEWDNRQRDSSLVLRGSDLQAAEAWLAQETNQMPAPTPLHTQYIFASQKDRSYLTNLIRTRTVLPFLLLTVIAAVLGVFLVTSLMDANLQDRITNQLREDARRASSSIANLEQQQKITLQLIASSVDARRALAEDNENDLSDLLLPIAIDRDISLLIVLNETGEIVAVVRRDGPDYDGKLLAEMNLSNASAIAKTLEIQAIENGNSYSEIVLINDEHTLLTAGPIYDENEFAGVASAGTPVEEMLTQVRAEVLADLTLYQTNGEILGTTFAQSNPEQLRISNEFYEMIVDASPSEELFLEESRQSKMEVRELDQRQYQFAYVPLTIGQNTLAVLSVALPSDFIATSSTMNRTAVAVYFSIGTVLVVIIGYVIVQYLTRSVTLRK